MMTNRVPLTLLLLALMTAGARSVAAADERPEPTRRATPGATKDAENGSAKEEAIEHTVILGAGGAGELELREGSFHPGPSVFIEYEAIENWLELELGASLLFAEGGFELPVDLLVKKPFRFSRSVEFMVGLGPEILRVGGRDKDGTFGGIEFALDFMFWPSQHAGLWVEPSYDIVFRSGTSHGVGSTGGVILGW